MSQGTARLKRHLEKLGEQREVDTQAFRCYLKGKRVVFVGPAPNLIGQGLGKFIDSFDVIVRTGGAPPVAEELMVDYGSRTEVWYVNSVFLNRFDKGRIPVCLAQGLRWVCVRGMLAGERYFETAPVSMRIFSTRIHGCQKPIIGVCLAKEITDAEVAELHITGVTFFVDGFNNSHLDGYLTSELKHRQNAIREDGRDELEAMGHDYHHGDLFIRQLYEEGRVTMSRETLRYLNTALDKNSKYVSAR